MCLALRVLELLLEAAVVRTEVGQFDRALTLLKPLIEAGARGFDGFPKAVFHAAELLRRLGQHEKSVQYLKWIIEQCHEERAEENAKRAAALRCVVV